MNAIRFLSLAALTLALSGCSRGFPVTGTVTRGGEPLSAGLITIEPEASSDTKGTGASAPIRDGKFEIEKGKHLVPGHYVVRVSPETLGSGMDLKTAPPQFKPWETKVEITNDEQPMNLDVPKK